MRKIKYILGGMVILLGVTTSCTDFLQKDPLSNPSEAIFWQKKSDFDAALGGCFSMMYGCQVLSQQIPCLDNLTDNGICQHNQSTYGNSQTIAQGDITPLTGGFIGNTYSACYQAIARIHILLENLEKYKGGDLTEADRNFYMGQCKALRAYFYSTLYLCYREVPLVTHFLNLDDMYQEKASRQDIYNQIIKDFDDAIGLVPDKPYSDSKYSGYLTLSAVKGLKARILLNDAYDNNGNVRDVEKLKEVVSSLESINDYSLSKSLRENFLETEQISSTEIMFSVRYLRPNLLHQMDLFYGHWAAVMVTRDLVDEFECIDGKMWGESPLTETVDDDLLLKYTTEEGKAEAEKLFKNRDPRLVESICYGNGLTFPDAGFEGTFIAVTNPSQTGFYPIKLLQPRKEMIHDQTISDVDIVILRYAEILLMIAEAENELNGPNHKVYDAINKIRVRSDMPVLPSGLSKEEMRERIRHEWRVEFAFEGKRYFQLKRWNLMEKEVNGAVDPAWPNYKKVFKPAFMYWPIPQGEIDKANGILTQDPNY